MAYISAEDVKAIRNELKATFPNLKFGVKKMHKKVDNKTSWYYYIRVS